MVFDLDRQTITRCQLGLVRLHLITMLVVVLGVRTNSRNEVFDRVSLLE